MKVLWFAIKDNDDVIAEAAVLLLLTALSYNRMPSYGQFILILNALLGVAATGFAMVRSCCRYFQEREK